MAADHRPSIYILLRHDSAYRATYKTALRSHLRTNTPAKVRISIHPATRKERGNNAPLVLLDGVPEELEEAVRKQYSSPLELCAVSEEARDGGIKVHPVMRGFLPPRRRYRGDSGKRPNAASPTKTRQRKDSYGAQCSAPAPTVPRVRERKDSYYAQCSAPAPTVPRVRERKGRIDVNSTEKTQFATSWTPREESPAHTRSRGGNDPRNGRHAGRQAWLNWGWMPPPGQQAASTRALVEECGVLKRSNSAPAVKRATSLRRFTTGFTRTLSTLEEQSQQRKVEMGTRPRSEADMAGVPRSGFKEVLTRKSQLSKMAKRSEEGGDTIFFVGVLWLTCDLDVSNVENKVVMFKPPVIPPRTSSAQIIIIPPRRSSAPAVYSAVVSKEERPLRLRVLEDRTGGLLRPSSAVENKDIQSPGVRFLEGCNERQGDPHEPTSNHAHNNINPTIGTLSNDQQEIAPNPTPQITSISAPPEDRFQIDPTTGNASISGDNLTPRNPATWLLRRSSSTPSASPSSSFSGMKSLLKRRVSTLRSNEGKEKTRSLKEKSSKGIKRISGIFKES
ncbi:hypothetical protein BDD12DRAFT_894700 [Trichophaea hybrida]|nr:hypothetical protein BDD12DRAFT_894700 [Trichophaea hybrida]